MSLPGKIFIAYLEEDDPQKSYFRLKPLIVEENDAFVPFAEEDAFPTDGCIRIVPDKNEAIHFKNRMRNIGSYVTVDLRSYPNENNKIRSNKNYQRNETEKNAFIIYSDVVSSPAPGTLFSFVDILPEDAENAILNDRPDSTYLLLNNESGTDCTVWTYESDEAQDCVRLVATDTTVDTATLQKFDMVVADGKKLRFAVAAPSAHNSEMPEIAPAAKPVPPVAAEPATAPNAPEHPTAAAPVPAPAPAEAPAQKPWISHDPLFKRPGFDRHLSPRELAMAEQCGLNPRRSRSLMEIMDEKWRLSRMDQLGCPTDAIRTDAPADRDEDALIQELRALWEMPEYRESIVHAFADADGLEEAMEARRATLKESAVNAQLEGLEMQRLQMLADIDNLRKNSAEVRSMLKQEIRRDEADAFAEAVSKTEAARKEQEDLEKQNESLRGEAESARDALNALVDGRFEQRLNDYFINQHAANVLVNMKKVTEKPAHVNGSAADADALIQRVRECFIQADQPIDRTGAIDLLICAAQSPVLLVSGAPGAGKTNTVRLLARALGIESSRYREVQPGKKPAAVRMPQGDTPAMVLVDDANLCPNEDMMRGLTPEAQSGRFTLCATLQDDGHAVPAYIFDRAFTLRLAPVNFNAAWTGSSVHPPKSYAPVTGAALQSAFGVKQGTLPPTVLARMEKVRGDLALLGVRPSRRTLKAVYDYCVTAIAYMPIEPTSVLDLAISHRMLPAILAGAPMGALEKLPRVFADMPRCKALLQQPLPIQF